jgi:hypothetical protein
VPEIDEMIRLDGKVDSRQTSLDADQRPFNNPIFRHLEISRQPRCAALWRLLYWFLVIGSWFLVSRACIASRIV